MVPPYVSFPYSADIMHIYIYMYIYVSMLWKHIHIIYRCRGMTFELNLNTYEPWRSLKAVITLRKGEITSSTGQDSTGQEMITSSTGQDRTGQEMRLSLNKKRLWTVVYRRTPNECLVCSTSQSIHKHIYININITKYYICIYIYIFIYINRQRNAKDNNPMLLMP